MVAISCLYPPYILPSLLFRFRAALPGPGVIRCLASQPLSEVKLTGFTSDERFEQSWSGIVCFFAMEMIVGIMISSNQEVL